MHCTCLYCICCLHAQNVQPLQKEGHVPLSKLRLVHLVQAADASRLTKNSCWNIRSMRVEVKPSDSESWNRETQDQNHHPKILWNASKVPELSGAVQSKPERMSHSCHARGRIVLGGLLMLSVMLQNLKFSILVHLQQTKLFATDAILATLVKRGKLSTCASLGWPGWLSLKDHLDDSIQKNMKYRCCTTWKWTMDVPVRNSLKVLIYRIKYC